VEQTPPDIILLDIMMPGMSGYEVCRRLMQETRTAGIPVIFVTAMAEIDDETKGFELGAVDYITKPISPPVVLARVATHLRVNQITRKLARQNRELKEYARLRDEVERITRHDIKTPLNSVISVPGMLMEELELNDNQRELLQMLEASGHRMLEIVNSSLDMYKMETGRYEFTPEPVDIIGLLCQIHSETREMIHQKGLQVIIFYLGRPVQPSDAIWAFGEEMLIYNMMANLLKNAAEASPQGQTISITLEKTDHVLMRIHNQGVVPRSIRDKFFDKFITAGKPGGTGLGTYTTKLIAETLGGGVGMTSSEDEGTMISAWLPMSVEEGERKLRMPLPAVQPLPGAASAKEQSIQPAPGFSAFAPYPERFQHDPDLSILVVDDYSNMRRITKSALRRMGYSNISEADDGEKALRMASSYQFGLIISDVRMPNMSGLQFLKAVRAHPEIHGTPFILVTGEADQKTVMEAADAKVSAFILKPYSPDSLNKKIAQALKNKA
jgi:two-component system sensor histidine kinase/response regulator